MFGNDMSGRLIPISDVDQVYGEWQHKAFVPDPLPGQLPPISSTTHLRIADARAALAALDSTAAQLPNPRLFRTPTLRREAQSTSALEGTYAPLGEVLTADEETPDTNIREILNYVRVADHAFNWVQDGRPLSVPLLCEVQEQLVRGTPLEGSQSGDVRTVQVVIGRRPDAARQLAPVIAARFVPPPPGSDLRAQLVDLLDWMNDDHTQVLDPVAASGMAHYQFETLHPFHDGNGRIGRLLIPLHLHLSGTLVEPTLTVSPWFEARRTEYYDHLLSVSTRSDWDGWLAFYAEGLAASATDTRTQMLNLVAVQRELHELVRSSNLRAHTASHLVDYAVANTSFKVRDVERDLSISYGRANKLVEQLVGLEILQPVGAGRSYGRRFYAPRVLRVLAGASE